MRFTLSVPLIAVAAAALPLSDVSAQVAPADSAAPAIIAHATDIPWAAGPPSLPPGAEFAVLEGNPGEAGPLTMRLRLPANYTIPPHFHSAIEHITILEGTFNVGMGATMDRSAGTALQQGSFAAVPVGMQHYAWTGDAPTVVQLHTVGPWTITYVNPDDDPRGRKPGT